MSDEARAPEKLPRPQQIDTLTPDQLVAVILRLTMEISVLRDRLATHESLLAEHDLLSPDAFENYAPDRDEQANRAADRTRLIDHVIRDLSGG